MSIIVVVDFIGVLIEEPELLKKIEPVKSKKAYCQAYQSAWRNIIQLDNNYFENSVIDEPARLLWNTLLDLAEQNLIEAPIIYLGGLSKGGTTFRRMKTCITRLLGNNCLTKADVSPNKGMFLAELSEKRDYQILLIDDNEAWNDFHRNNGGATFHFIRENFTARDLHERIISLTKSPKCKVRDNLDRIVHEEYDNSDRDSSSCSHVKSMANYTFELRTVHAIPDEFHSCEDGEHKFKQDTIAAFMNFDTSVTPKDSPLARLYTIALMLTSMLGYIAELDTGVCKGEKHPYGSLAHFFKRATDIAAVRFNACLALAYMEYVAFTSLVKANCCFENAFLASVEKLGLLANGVYNDSPARKFVHKESLIVGTPQFVDLHLLMISGLYMFMWRYDEIMHSSIRNKLARGLAVQHSDRLEVFFSFGKRILDACEAGRCSGPPPLFFYSAASQVLRGKCRVVWCKGFIASDGFV